MSRGALFHLLANRLYRGEIVHKGLCHPGLHAPIVDAETFAAVQDLLAANRMGDGRRGGKSLSAPLAGRIFDDRGNPMSPVSARKGPKVYRYYVSTAAQSGATGRAGSKSRVPAAELEALLRSRLAPITGSDGDLSAVRRVTVASDELSIALDEACTGPGAASALPLGDRLEHGAGILTLTISAQLCRRGGRQVAVNCDGASAISEPRVDTVLLKALVRAEAWKACLYERGADALDSMLADEDIDRVYAKRLIRLAFLSPALKTAILAGSAPPHLTLKALVRGGIPLSWGAQAWKLNHRLERTTPRPTGTCGS